MLNNHKCHNFAQFRPNIYKLQKLLIFGLSRLKTLIFNILVKIVTFTNLIINPIKKLQEFKSEYELLIQLLNNGLNFESSFELKRKIRNLDNKTLLVLKKIDPVYESLIRNNFNQIESNTLSSLLNRISLLESIMIDLDNIIVNVQIN